MYAPAQATCSEGCPVALFLGFWRGALGQTRLHCRTSEGAPAHILKLLAAVITLVMLPINVIYGPFDAPGESNLYD
jgi:hypothetical protein